MAFAVLVTVERSRLQAALDGRARVRTLIAKLTDARQELQRSGPERQKAAQAARRILTEEAPEFLNDWDSVAMAGERPWVLTKIIRELRGRL